VLIDGQGGANMPSEKTKSALKSIAKLLSPFKPLLEGIAELGCWIFCRFNTLAHALLLYVQWGIPPQPEFFDHSEDVFFVWGRTRNPLFLERGVYSSLALHGKSVLELCCGDGFNAKYFYSLRSASVLSCDFDPKAIRLAKQKNQAANVKFMVADIRTDVPVGKFENIIWDAAIEHFTLDETASILNNIKTRLTEDGILSGYTIVERATGKKQLSHHEYEFKDKDDLLRVLKPYFENVTVFETIYPGRHNLYFWASDRAVPFAEGWKGASQWTSTEKQGVA
jgi:SAM-dependent methyltransferase